MNTTTINNLQAQDFQPLNGLIEFMLDTQDKKLVNRWEWLGYTMDLKPLDNTVKSFYGKAKVIISQQQGGSVVARLKSYDTIVARVQYFKNGDKRITRTCGEEALSHTTLRHIKAGLGLNKREFLALGAEE